MKQIIIIGLLFVAACSTDSRLLLVQRCEDWTSTLKVLAAMRASNQLSDSDIKLIDSWRPTVNAICIAPPPENTGAALDIVESALIRASGIKEMPK